jgi:ADP-ribose pyrophosphatase YjhB (NUDIX family)
MSQTTTQLTCSNQCCSYSIAPYSCIFASYNPYPPTQETKIKKAGSFIYDRQHNKILLVQSRGQLWGPPKGSMQDNETTLECSIREVKEETGIDITEADLNGSIVVKQKALYYFMETDMSRHPVEPQYHIKDNDANGIGWFNVDCLNDLILSGHISVNQHCRILIKRIFNKDIIYNTITFCQKKRLLLPQE